MRLLNCLFITALVIVLTFIVFGELRKAIVYSTNQTAGQIRKPGRR